MTSGGAELKRSKFRWRKSGGGKKKKKNLDSGECQNEGRNSGAGGVVVKDSVTISERKETVEMCAPNQL